ncbi:PepSY domain-containing protein [Metabacillus herbersteinensis]|uniref:PepSY domain-containing protein n=1 Tax=Metabacillus herbersteinensis TaxID=283816 RepID=A0ABV6G9W4_9BACI
MRWNQFFLGIGIGAALTYLASSQLKPATISSDKALHIVKKAFKQRGKIDGSWIYTVPEEYKKNDLTYQIYKTGITRTADGEVEQYETIVDATTGTILEVNRV